MRKSASLRRNYHTVSVHREYTSTHSIFKEIDSKSSTTGGRSLAVNFVLLSMKDARCIEADRPESVSSVSQVSQLVCLSGSFSRK